MLGIGTGLGLVLACSPKTHREDLVRPAASSSLVLSLPATRIVGGRQDPHSQGHVPGVLCVDGREEIILNDFLGAGLGPTHSTSEIYRAEK